MGPGEEKDPINSLSKQPYFDGQVSQPNTMLSTNAEQLVSSSTKEHTISSSESYQYVNTSTQSVDANNTQKDPHSVKDAASILLVSDFEDSVNPESDGVYNKLDDSKYLPTEKPNLNNDSNASLEKGQPKQMQKMRQQDEVSESRNKKISQNPSVILPNQDSANQSKSSYPPNSLNSYARLSQYDNMAGQTIPDSNNVAANQEDVRNNVIQRKPIPSQYYQSNRPMAPISGARPVTVHHMYGPVPVNNPNYYNYDPPRNGQLPLGYRYPQYRPRPPDPYRGEMPRYPYPPQMHGSEYYRPANAQPLNGQRNLTVDYRNFDYVPDNRSYVQMPPNINSTHYPRYSMRSDESNYNPDPFSSPNILSGNEDRRQQNSSRNSNYSFISDQPPSNRQSTYSNYARPNFYPTPQGPVVYPRPLYIPQYRPDNIYIQERPRNESQIPITDLQMNPIKTDELHENIESLELSSPKRKMVDEVQTEELKGEGLMPPPGTIGRRQSINFDPAIVKQIPFQQEFKADDESVSTSSQNDSSQFLGTGSRASNTQTGTHHQDSPQPSESSEIATQSENFEYNNSFEMPTFVATLVRKPQLTPAQALALKRQDAIQSMDPKINFEFAKALLASGEPYVDEGFALLRRLANSGYAEANFFLGDAFADDGKDTQAYNQYLMAAKRGYAPACHAIGVCAENGRGCKKNYRLALEMYTKAASAGNLDSMYRLGLAELEGSLGLRPDIEKAVKWFKRAIAGIRRIKALVPNKEHPEPLFELAKIYEIGYPPYISQDYAYARGVLQEAVEFNYPPAIYKLGYAYEHGLMGIEANAAESIRLYKAAIEFGIPDGYLGMAGWYMTGAQGHLQKDEIKAFALVKKASESGLARGQFTLGYFYDQGIGTEKNDAEAIRLFKLAADQGDSRAIKRLSERGLASVSNKKTKKKRSIFGLKF